MLITVGALGLLSSLDPLRPVVFLLLLRTDRARLNAIGFLVGWAIATAALFTVGFVAFDAGTAGRASSPQKTWLSGAELVLAVALLALALRRWRRRNETTTHRTTPARLQRQLERLTPRRAGILGVLVQPRTVTILAAVVVARDRAGLASVGVGFFVFALFSSGALLGLFTYFVRRPDRAESRLGDLAEWIEQAGPMLFAVACALVGSYLLFDGIRGVVR